MRVIDIDRKTAPASPVDPGVAPMLQWIRIEDLVIDDTYQRDLKRGNWNAIARIANSFRWSRFSPVLVAPIEGGKFAVIDGQHRAHAAALCGLEQVPGQVVQMTREEQAASFAAVNGMVTKVTAWQVCKAAIAAGEPWAVTCSSIAAEAGCSLMTRPVGAWTEKKPGQIFGVTTFRKIVESAPRETVVAALKVLMAAEGYRDAPEIWETSVLAPLLKALVARRAILANGKLVDALERYDIWAVIDDIAKATKDRLRKGLPFAPKKEQLELRFGDWLDERFGSR